MTYRSEEPESKSRFSVCPPTLTGERKSAAFCPGFAATVPVVLPFVSSAADTLTPKAPVALEFAMKPSFKPCMLYFMATFFIASKPFGPGWAGFNRRGTLNDRFSMVTLGMGMGLGAAMAMAAKRATSRKKCADAILKVMLTGS
jgi:hypothetical protein